MNALSIIQAASPVGFDDWLASGRLLLQQRNELDWRLGDWLAEGRETFGNQAAFDFLADELGIAPKQLKSAVKVATAFPPHMRDTALTFQHHEAVATLPTVEALDFLKSAKTNHLDDRETRIEAVRRKVEIGQTTLLPDDDWDHHALMAITRAWNRAPEHVRSEFLELTAEAELGDIDA